VPYHRPLPVLDAVRQLTNLLGGNLNNDEYIDVLDFGVYAPVRLFMSMTLTA
jgi:hypothetical protein